MKRIGDLYHLLLTAVLGVLLCACGADQPEPAGNTPPGGSSNLPALSPLREGNAALAGNERVGYQYELQPEPVNVSASAEQALFGPDWNPPASLEYAAAVYSFVPSPQLSPDWLGLDWSDIKSDGEVYIALMDWDSSRWRWIPSSQMGAALGDAGFNYRRPADGAVFAAVALLGQSPAKLLSISLIESEGPLTDWQQSFGSLADDSILDVYPAWDGGLWACGSMESPLNGHDAIVLRFSRNGQLLWGRSWATPGDDVAASAIGGMDGSVTLCGYTDAGDQEGTKPLLLRFNQFGDLLSQQIYEGGASGRFNSIDMDIQGRRQIAGSLAGGHGSGDDICLIRISPEGTLQTQSAYSAAPHNEALSLSVNLSGEIFVSGLLSGGDPGEQSDALMLKFNLDGALQGQLAWGGGVEPAARHVLQDVMVDLRDKGAYFCGTSVGHIGGNAGDVLLMAVDDNFAPLYVRHWESAADEQGSNIMHAYDGLMYITAASRSGPAERLLLIGLGRDGNERLAEQWDSGGTGSISPGGLWSVPNALLIGGTSPATENPQWLPASGNFVDADSELFYVPEGVRFNLEGSLEEADGSVSELLPYFDHPPDSDLKQQGFCIRYTPDAPAQSP